VKVLDFGIARLRELSPTTSKATRGGTSMGTPHYMPPEQARGRWEEVDARSDLWAVGATMFELLSGRRVHDGGTVNEVLLAAMTTHAPPVASVAPTVAPAVGYLVDKALRYERERRWPDAASMQVAVRSAYYDRHGAPITTAPKITVPLDVPNRTLLGADGTALPRLPTTARPVAHSGPLAARALARLSPGPRRLAVAGAAAGLAVLGAGFAVASLTRTQRGAAASVPPAAVASAPAVVAVSAAAAPAPAPPTLAVTELPSVPATPPTPTAVPRPIAAARAVTPSAPSPPAKPNCTPPYVLDSEGHTRWKPECF
jgi:serine/threonine protein kinase